MFVHTLGTLLTDYKLQTIYNRITYIYDFFSSKEDPAYRGGGSAYEASISLKK